MCLVGLRMARWSRGDHTLLWHLEQLGAEQFLVLRSLYDPDGVLGMGKFDAELTEMGVYRGKSHLLAVELYLSQTEGGVIYNSTLPQRMPCGKAWSRGLRAGHAECACHRLLDRPQSVQLGTVARAEMHVRVMKSAWTMSYATASQVSDRLWLSALPTIRNPF